MILTTTSVLATISVVGSFYLVGNVIIRKLRIISDNVSESAEEMLSASRNVSESSQTIAQVTSEQAAAIEETSASLEEISSMLKRSVNNTDDAKILMTKTKTIISNVTGHMEKMALAMQEISETSAQTAKIIKTIDEIAFQTNLLALNAAVEAARAGESGAGFAVVADEVRNLAIRAAEAARNTNQLIESIASVVKKGSELTPLTQSAFAENIEVADKICEIVDDIAKLSRDQESGIRQITKAVAELDRISQINAGTSEESAAAAEEMNAQSLTAKQAVSNLLTLIHGAAN
ncbi:MAG: methyl-accepting chemotaxis protein [Deltaproteobacteria bacterium]|nr:methyl-accepting chemotaxis protein [Deltaproteobacteria bacterium]